MTIKVKINPDGLTATEMNPIKRPNSRHFSAKELEYDGSEYWKQEDRWATTESKLRTFEIESRIYYGENIDNGEKLFGGYIDGTIHSAEILPNGRIKIL